MIVKTQYRKLDNKGIRPFTVVKDIDLDILTEDLSKDGIKKTFLKDGKFLGELVEVKMQKKLPNGNYVRFGQGKGFMIRNEDNTGMWLIPFAITAPYNESLSKIDGELNSLATDVMPVVSEIKDTVSQTLAEKEKTVFGFTYKQLAVIGLLMLIARKL